MTAEVLRDVRNPEGGQRGGEFRNSKPALDRIVGVSKAIKVVKRQIEGVARRDMPVLICGETGTGKELVATAIHEMSPRSREELVAVNCPAIPESLAEAEFFGHGRGAFTGAVGDQEGVFTRAHKGTLFLDEIGDLPLALQAKLLRVLQSGVYRKVGGAKDMHSDFRLISATNKDIRKELEQGRFRKDFLHRINTIQIDIPPLSERREDIAPIARAYFAEKEEGIDCTPDAFDVLKAQEFEGNVRTIQKVVENAIVIASTHDVPITGDVVMSALRVVLRGKELLVSSTPSEGQTLDLSPVPPELVAMFARGDYDLERAKRILVVEALRATGGYKERAADLLGVTAKTVWNMRHNMNIRPEEYEPRSKPHGEEW